MSEKPVSQLACVVLISLAYLITAVGIFGFVAGLFAILSLLSRKKFSPVDYVFSSSAFWVLLAASVGVVKRFGQWWYKKSGYAITQKIEYLSIGVGLFFWFIYFRGLVYISNIFNLLEL
jgi:hypothetical protein